MPRLTLPHHLVGSAADLRPKELLDINPQTKAAIFDFDCTLAEHGATELPPDSLDMIIQMGRAGIWVFVSTNIYDEHAYDRQRMLRKLRDPKNGERLIVETVIPETVTPREGDPHAFKKPASDMPAYVLRTYGLIANRVFMIGDQQRSDMKSVEGLSIHRVLTDKRGELDHPIVRFNRPIEELQRHLGGYGLFPPHLTSIEDWMALSFAERLAIDRQRRQPIDISN